MRARDYLETYLEGWRTGDANKSLGVTADGFFYDDPATGRVARADFIAFVEAFKADGAALTGGQLASPFLQYSDLTVTEANASNTPGTAWCWWRITETDFQGSAFITFDDTGILSERIAYFTGNPTETAIPGDKNQVH